MGCGGGALWEVVVCSARSSSSSSVLHSREKNAHEHPSQHIHSMQRFFFLDQILLYIVQLFNVLNPPNQILIVHIDILPNASS